MQGADTKIRDALAQGQLDDAPVSDKERALLQFVRKLTLTPSEMGREDAQTLRDAGWEESQIAEAVYETGIFAFFNRVADAFGLENPNPEIRVGGEPSKSSQSARLPAQPGSDSSKATQPQDKALYIKVIDESEATGNLAMVYRMLSGNNQGRGGVPAIVKCFSHRPDFLYQFTQFTDELHFTRGSLTVRQKERIGTFVSATNKCHY